MTQRETPILRAIMLRLSKLGVRLFRNNQGVAVYESGARVVYGICNPGGSDLIGWHSVTVTPEMVGRKMAVFVAVEVKAGNGRMTKPQAQFIQVVREAGGVAFVAYCEDEAEAMFRTLAATSQAASVTTY